MIIYVSLPIISLMMTANRSGIILSLLRVCSVFILTRFRSFVFYFIPTISIFIFLLLLMSEHIPFLEYYGQILSMSSKLSLGQTQLNSDLLRVVAFNEALNQLPYNFFGNAHGYVYIEDKGYIDPHNTITLFILAAGVPGIIFLLYLLVKAILFFKKYARHKKNKYENMLLLMSMSSLFSAFLFNQVHVGVSNGILWAFIGLFTYQIERYFNEKKIYSYYR